METIICSKCRIEKPISDFNKKKDRYSYYCKECNKLYMKQYYEEMKNNPDYQNKRKEYAKSYKRPQASIEKHLQKTREWRKENKEHIREYAKKYDNEHREEKINRDRQWRKKHPDKVKIYQQNDYNKRMYNPILKVELQLRNMINMSFKRKKYIKNKRLEMIVGMKSSEMVEYLLQTFKNNYGYEWDEKEPVHIDHIIPLATAKVEEDVIKLCHYSNLQLLKAQDNLQKNNKLDWVLKER